MDGSHSVRHVRLILCLSDGSNDFVDGFAEAGVIGLIALRRDGHQLAIIGEQHPHRLDQYCVSKSNKQRSGVMSSYGAILVHY